MIQAGELRNRGEFQRITDYSAIDTEGDWTAYATAWAKIEPTGGREYVEGRKVQAETTHMLKTRFISGVRPDMRFVHEGRVFKIVYAYNVDERNRELMIECTEETDNNG